MSALINLTDTELVVASFLVMGLPLLSFVFSFLFKKIAPLISIASITLSFISSLVLFLAVWNSGETYHFQKLWISFASFKVHLGFLINNLTVLMLLLITFIALLVNVYSVEYMRKDQAKPKYFAYLSFFCFAMLGLVLADNLFVVYAFWELVGFASYLLIGFWFTRESAVKANKKAMLMNRIGDIGFLAGLMILFSQFKTVDIETIFGAGNLIGSSFVANNLWVTPFSTLPDYWLTIAGLCFFAGAVAKSAQFPLHTWLPDAMEGPTAVSSLIHAATMVAAGVFLLVRIEPLFNETVLIVIASIGVFTAFMAATMAITQNDIKRVLAFSTISQLGFMMLAIGIGDSAAAVFHLVTHAFFKCLLFLGAGIVIHEMQHLKAHHSFQFDPQNMLNMGGFKKWMPVTTIIFIAAAVALAGLPFTSGYLSKDAILLSLFNWADTKGGVYWIFPILLSITSWLTTFYIFRVVFKVFFGEFRLPKIMNFDFGKQPFHDPSNWMKVPVVILAVFCIGFVFAINPLSIESSWLYHQFAKVAHPHNAYHLFVPIYINVLSVILIMLSYYIYAKQKFQFNLEQSWIYKFSYNQWYFNELYDTVFVKPIIAKTKFWYWFDKNIIDGIVNLSGNITITLSKFSSAIDKYLIDGLVNFAATVVERIGIWFRAVHSGRVQQYVIWVLLVFLSFFIFQMIF